jgi:nickel-dependent lactate racemase
MTTNFQKNDNKIVEIAYGKSRLKLNVPSNFDVIEPKFLEEINAPKLAIENSLKNPINSKPLRDIINSDSVIAISVCDITRAQPREIVLKAIIEHIEDIVPKSNIKILIATGTHRINTQEELISMLGKEIVNNLTVINHVCDDKESLIKMDTSLKDVDVLLNKHWVEADIRITTGFVEPHFFAGFSGGSKLVAPGLAGLKTIMKLHNFERLNNPNSIWGEINNNPIQQDVRKIAKETGVDFTVDVTLNRDQKITNIFSGNLIDSHNIACDFARKTAMVEVEKPYDIVITSNSGYPLDQNLYQTVKGLSAASQIVKKGGEILCLSECSDGIPNHGKFYSLLSEFNKPDQVEDVLADPNFHCQDQWQVQILSQIAKKTNINLYTEGLSEDEIKNAFMISVQNPQNYLNEKILSNQNIRGCVLPEGPITIPFFN